MSALKTAFFLLLYIFLNGQGVYAQLQIAPVALYMGDDNTTGRIVIQNSTSNPVEVEVELLFGYPITDENGKVFIKIFESIPDDEPSAKEWIRIYPRNLILEGNERQTIRFAARPPAHLPNGEYWVRPSILAKSLNGLTEYHDEQNITTRLNLHKRTILSLNYRKGNVHTGVDITDLSTSHNDGLLRIFAGLERKGNAAFLGHFELKILDNGGDKVLDKRQEIAVYKDQNRTFEIHTGNLRPGTYTAEIELTTRYRNDDGILQASPATASATFTIP